MRLFDIFNKGLAVEVLSNTFKPTPVAGNSSPLHRMIAFVLRVFFGIQTLKYLAIGVMFAGCLAINEIQSLFGLIEKEEVYVKSATSVNCFVDSIKSGFKSGVEGFLEGLTSESEATYTYSDEIAYSDLNEEYIKGEQILLSNSSNNVGEYSFKYNNEDRGQSLVDIIKAQKEEQSLNMTAKALGTYRVRKPYH